MERRNRTPEENARRALIRELLQKSDISSMEDIRICSRKPLPSLWKMVWKRNWTRN